MKKVSAIIPTFNRAHCILDAIDSIVAQPYPNVEIIVVDDRSSDHTRDLLAHVETGEKELIVLSNHRTKGPAGARNTGLERATGDYIAFLDSDDHWCAEHLQNGIPIMEDHPQIDVLFGDYEIMDAGAGSKPRSFLATKTRLQSLRKKPLGAGAYLLADNLFAALIEENFFHLASSLLRRRFIAAGLRLNEAVAFSEDRDFAIRLAREFHARFALRQDTVFRAFKHAHNMTSESRATRKRILTDHLTLFYGYQNKYPLDACEARLLAQRIAATHASLSYIARTEGAYHEAFSAWKASLRAGWKKKHLVELLKIVTFLLLRRRLHDL